MSYRISMGVYLVILAKYVSYRYQNRWLSILSDIQNSLSPAVRHFYLEKGKRVKLTMCTVCNFIKRATIVICNIILCRAVSDIQNRIVLNASV